MDISCIKEIELERVVENILQTSTVAWGQKVTRASLQRWLNNFTGEALGDQMAEQSLAAWLLANFTYYTQEEVRELCRTVFRKFVHEKLAQPKYQELNMPISDKIKQILQRTVFLPLGNISESGAVILFLFRGAAHLSKDIFEAPPNWMDLLKSGEKDDVVLIDDVTLSGSQAIQYIKDYSLDANVTLLTFFATPEAIRNIRDKNPTLSPLYAILIDERSKLFSDSSFVFANKECQALRAVAHKMCTHYGKKIVEQELVSTAPYMIRYPLGFGDGQQMFAFFYNTPDNTLPIFWCDSAHWSPIFSRTNKVYSIEEVEFSDEQYW